MFVEQDFAFCLLVIIRAFMLWLLFITGLLSGCSCGDMIMLVSMK